MKDFLDKQQFINKDDQKSNNDPLCITYANSNFSQNNSNQDDDFENLITTTIYK